MQEIQPIVDAINNLQPKWYEQYVFPILGWIAALFTGGILTIWGMRINEKYKVERENLLITNSFLLTVDACVSHLSNIKKFYAEIITDNPVRRALDIPAFNTTQNQLDFDISRLTFIVFKKDEEVDLTVKSWRDLRRIRAFVENYNYFLKILDKRDNLMPEINNLLVGEESQTPGVNLSFEDIKTKLGGLRLAYYVEITEQLILVVDHLLIEGRDFLLNFIPEIRPHIEMDRLKKFNLRLVDISKKEETLNSKIFDKCTPLDFEFASIVLGRPVEHIKFNLTIK